MGVLLDFKMVPMFHTLLVVFAFWCLLFSVNKLFGSYGPFKNLYLQCQDDFGISVAFFHIRVYSTRFNSLFKIWGGCNRKLARLWFDVGVLTGLLLMGFSIFIMIFALYQSVTNDEQSKDKQILTPLMPGVNLPWNEVSYYFVTIVVCGVFHEVGHALAAVTEQVRINGFGIFVFFIYPGAFVDLHSDHLTIVSPRRQLRIYCAGVWHNVILSVTMALFLQSLPYILLPFYTQGQGAVITRVERESVFYNQLFPGDAIIQIDSCRITNSRDWYSCVADITSHSQTGYCVDIAYLLSHKMLSKSETTLVDDNVRECCPSDTKSDLCFSVTNLSHSNNDKLMDEQFVCLTARQVLTTNICHNSNECSIVKPNSICITPTIAMSQYNHLAKIKHTGIADPVIFVGDLRTLLFTTKTGDFLPLYSSTPLWIPPLLQTLAIYIISISSALALLNMLPAFALDGQWALSALIEIILPEHPKRNKIVNGILTAGTILLVMNIILGIWILVNW